MISAFSMRSTGVERSRASSCAASIVVGRPFRITVTLPVPASVSVPLPFGDARQLRERLVGVVHRLAPDHVLQVVGQPALLDPHHGRSPSTTTAPIPVLRSCRVTVPGLAARSGESGEFVGNVLEQQTVGLHGRDDLETAFRVGRCGRDVGRVGRRASRPPPPARPPFGILDAAAHAGTPFLRAGGRRDGIRRIRAPASAAVGAAHSENSERSRNNTCFMTSLFRVSPSAKLSAKPSCRYVSDLASCGLNS